MTHPSAGWTPPSQQAGRDQPAADDTAPPADRGRGISRRLVAVLGTLLIAVIVVVVMSLLV